MAFLTWSDKLSVGVAEFDNQHKKLIELVNRLHDSMAQGKSKDVLGPIFDELINYTATHFAAEEKLMQEHGYALMPTHVLEHKNLVKQALELQTKFKSGAVSISVEVLTFLKNWLSHHILEVDMKYGPHFNSKGVK